LTPEFLRNFKIQNQVGSSEACSANFSFLGHNTAELAARPWIEDRAEILHANALQG
jgi:hypothetical protein